MPQLDPSSFFSQIFWLSISFAILYLLIGKIIVPNISKIISERKNIIETDLYKAEQAKITAENIEKLYKNSIENAYNKANKLIEETKDQIKEETNQKLAILNLNLNKKLIEAENKIKNLQNNSAQEIELIATNIVKSICDKQFRQYINENQLGLALNEIQNVSLKGLN